MSHPEQAIWINVSQSLRMFDRSLISILSHKLLVTEWQYCQTQDEPTSLSKAMSLLHSYMEKREYPVHLLGHGTGGLLALLYASRYPEKVLSLTLLSVGVYPAVDWQAHYYVQSSLLPCPRHVILSQTVRSLFGNLSQESIIKYRRILEQDLDESLSPHSLYKRVSVPPIEVSVPLFVCGSRNDVVIDQKSLYGWQPYLKSGDRIWQCPSGGYFFHYFYPLEVSTQIVDFWKFAQVIPQNLPDVNTSMLMPDV